MVDWKSPNSHDFWKKTACRWGGSTSNPAGWRRRLHRNWFSHFFNGGCFWWTQGLLIELFWENLWGFSPPVFHLKQLGRHDVEPRETCFVASNKVGEVFFFNCFLDIFYVKKRGRHHVQFSSQKTWETWWFNGCFLLRLFRRFFHFSMPQFLWGIDGWWAEKSSVASHLARQTPWVRRQFLVTIEWPVNLSTCFPWCFVTQKCLERVHFFGGGEYLLGLQVGDAEYGDAINQPN